MKTLVDVLQEIRDGELRPNLVVRIMVGLLARARFMGGDGGNLRALHSCWRFLKLWLRQRSLTWQRARLEQGRRRIADLISFLDRQE
jgi:hypothetical protein